MLTIPAGLDRWHPNDITEWAAALDGDQAATVADLRRAERAVTTALLGCREAVQIHGPVPEPNPRLLAADHLKAFLRTLDFDLCPNCGKPLPGEHLSTSADTCTAWS